MAVFAKAGKQCVYCKSTEKLTIDHIVPKALGGLDTLDNLQTLCFQCNQNKSHSTQLSWIKRILSIWRSPYVMDDLHVGIKRTHSKIDKKVSQLEKENKKCHAMCMNSIKNLSLIQETMKEHLLSDNKADDLREAFLDIERRLSVLEKN